MTQGILQTLLERLNGKDFERHDNELIFEIRRFEKDGDAISLLLKSAKNPDYDPNYWQNLKEQQESKGADNDNNE